MRNTVILFVLLTTVSLNAQSIIGAWEATFTNKGGEQYRSVVIFADAYQTATIYDAVTGEFKSSNGGSWTLDGDMMTEVVEFDSNNSDRVGEEVTFEIELTENTMKILGVDLVWNRIDDGAPGDLKGAWLMSGRKRDGEFKTRDTSLPRKTMKILSGTRFQWIAYNTETKQFMATGGGTYTTVDGKYTERIEFFSRDATRVGASLEFDYDLKDGDWHHSGFSSKGDPLYEVWSLRK